MHSSTTPSGRRYHHNTDFSGPVIIVLSAEEADNEDGSTFASVPVEDLRAIVAAADASATDASTV